jgi:TPR repeat protein
MDNLNFIIDSEIDAKIREKFTPPNWGEVFFGWLSPKLQDKLFAMIEEYKTGYFVFLNGVRYEYGIGVDLDLKKAIELYYIAADQLNDSYALFRLYFIHFFESQKFGVIRDRSMEMYYLLKSMAFSDAAIFFNNDTLYNIDIIYQIAYHLDIEDPMLEKVNKLLIDKDIGPESRLVEAMALIKFNMDDDDIDLGIIILSQLAEENYLEAIYKLACLYAKPNDKYIKQKDSEKAEKYFRILEEDNFYKSFNDYGLFLYDEKRMDKCLEILRKGVENGNYRCYFLYYDCFLCKFDFFNGNIQEIVDLLEYVRRDLITGNIFSFFEYFYTMKILRKHFNLKDLSTEYEEEFLNIIENVYKNKNMLNNFAKGIVETEFLLSLGFINYIKKTDLTFSESLLKMSFTLSNNLSYKRFCYSYIFKIRNKHSTDIQKLDKTKSKLFKIYNESMDNNKLEDFSSSYFYFLAKIYESGWGCKQDYLRSYCYFLHASKARVKQLGTGTIIAYFRRYKAGMMILENRYKELENELMSYKEKELSNTLDDYSLCCICYENNKDVIMYPCKHMLCNRCYEIIKRNEKCPICRSKIIITK